LQRAEAGRINGPASRAAGGRDPLGPGRLAVVARQGPGATRFSGWDGAAGPRRLIPGAPTVEGIFSQEQASGYTWQGAGGTRGGGLARPPYVSATPVLTLVDPAETHRLYHHGDRLQPRSPSNTSSSSFSPPSGAIAGEKSITRGGQPWTVGWSAWGDGIAALFTAHGAGSTAIPATCALLKRTSAWDKRQARIFSIDPPWRTGFAGPGGDDHWMIRGEGRVGAQPKTGSPRERPGLAGRRRAPPVLRGGELGSRISHFVRAPGQSVSEQGFRPIPLTQTGLLFASRDCGPHGP